MHKNEQVVVTRETLAGNLATGWKWSDVLLFEILVCSVSFLFSFAGSIAPQLVVTVPKNGLSIDSNTALLLAGSVLPAFILLVRSKECRVAALGFAAPIQIYLGALLIGFLLPFSGYIGAQHSYPLWDSGSGSRLFRVFLINLLLSPLWEEIIWRAYFYPKLGSLLRLRQALIVGALGWTIWHVGFLVFLYKSGITSKALAVLAIQIFLFGVIACCIFSLGANRMAPCVLLHAAYNSSTVVYYGSYGRVTDIGSYLAQTVFMLGLAVFLFKAVARREHGELATES